MLYCKIAENLHKAAKDPTAVSDPDVVHAIAVAADLLDRHTRYLEYAEEFSTAQKAREAAAKAERPS